MSVLFFSPFHSNQRHPSGREIVGSQVRSLSEYILREPPGCMDQIGGLKENLKFMKIQFG